MDLPFLDQFHTKTFQKGETILMQGEIPQHAFIVKEGIVKVFNITADGEEKSIAFKLKDDIFSLAWLFSKSDCVLYFYEAFTDCTLHIVTKEAFHELLDKKVGMAHRLIDYLLNEHLSNGLRFNALGESQSRDKIVHTLQTLCLRYGIDVRPHIVRIPIPFRQQDIANMLGLTRETTALELKKLKEEGVIKYKNCIYTVNTSKLDTLLNDDYNPGIHLRPAA